MPISQHSKRLALISAATLRAGFSSAAASKSAGIHIEKSCQTRTAGIISFDMETTGCGTAIVTPFKADGSLDEQALKSLVNWQIDSGIDFIVACGSTGEAATLDEEEWLRTVSLVVEAAAGRVPVWAGCTHNSTRTLVRLAVRLKQVRGLSAVLSANPYYNKPSQEGQFQHFLALAKAVAPLPVTIYNIPGRTAANLEPETVGRLAAAASNIEAIKESSGRLPQVSAWCMRFPAASGFSAATTIWDWARSEWVRTGSSAWPPTRFRRRWAA